MDWHIYPHGTGWRLRKHGSGRSIAHFNFRREAITEAKVQAAKTNGIVYVHNTSGDVVIRIPELQHVAASVQIKKPGAMTTKGRKEIAEWLRKQSANLLKYGKDYNDTGDFRARYFYVDSRVEKK